MANYNSPKNKIVLTPEQENYLRRHFKHTSNDELAAHLGLSYRTVVRRAREMGLTKSRQFMRRKTEIGLSLARAKNESEGYYLQHRTAMRQWEKHRAEGTMPRSCFPKGHKGTLSPKKEAARRAKITASRNASLDRDRRRVRLGLEPLTKVIKPVNLTRRQIYHRSYMHVKAGYHIFRTDPGSVYYDDHTQRNEAMEQRAAEFDLTVRPLSERGTEIKVIAHVDAQADWSTSHIG